VHASVAISVVAASRFLQLAGGVIEDLIGGGFDRASIERAFEVLFNDEAFAVRICNDERCWSLLLYRIFPVSPGILAGGAPRCLHGLSKARFQIGGDGGVSRDGFGITFGWKDKHNPAGIEGLVNQFSRWDLLHAKEAYGDDHAREDKSSTQNGTADTGHAQSFD
jgi:hypothetical protein